MSQSLDNPEIAIDVVQAYAMVEYIVSILKDMTAVKPAVQSLQIQKGHLTLLGL